MSIVDASTSNCNAARCGEQNNQGANGTRPNNLQDQANGNGSQPERRSPLVMAAEPAESTAVPPRRAAIRQAKARAGEQRASYERALEAYKAEHDGQTPTADGTTLSDPANGQTHTFRLPETERLSPEDNAAIELMLLHAIRLPEVFSVAKNLLPPTDLGLPGEAAHACVWRHVYDYYQRTATCPTMRFCSPT